MCIFQLDPGLWYMGGGCGHARYFSRFVALQILADVEGKTLKIYKETPSAVNAGHLPLLQVGQTELTTSRMDNLAVAPHILALQQQEGIKI